MSTIARVWRQERTTFNEGERTLLVPTMNVEGGLAKVNRAQWSRTDTKVVVSPTNRISMNGTMPKNGFGQAGTMTQMRLVRSWTVSSCGVARARGGEHVKRHERKSKEKERQHWDTGEDVAEAASIPVTPSQPDVDACDLSDKFEWATDQGDVQTKKNP